MRELHCIARLSIKPGRLDDFKRLAAECAEIVRTKDTGTLQYDLYLNPQGTECVVVERYRDSAALMEHHQNLGGTFARMMETCSGEGEICGMPSDELRAQVEGSPVRIFEPFHP